MCLTLFTYAQDNSKHRAGLRLGNGGRFGASLSYQYNITTKNRLEFDFGWLNSTNNQAIKLATIYQWIMPLENRFNWYFGAGGALTNFNDTNTDNKTALLLAANIGLEYNLKIPVQITLGTRPELGFTTGVNALNLNTALGVRYRF